MWIISLFPDVIFFGRQMIQSGQQEFGDYLTLRSSVPPTGDVSTGHSLHNPIFVSQPQAPLCVTVIDLESCVHGGVAVCGDQCCCDAEHLSLLSKTPVAMDLNLLPQ